MKHAALFLPPGRAETARKALESGRLEELARIQPIEQIGPMQAYTAIWVDYHPPDYPGGENFEAYLSIRDVRMGGGLYASAKTHEAVGKYVVRMLAVSMDELRRLVHSLPDLESITGEAPPLPRREVETPDAQPERPGGDAVATVEGVEGAGRWRWDHFVAESLDGATYLGLFVSLVGVLMGTVMMLVSLDSVGDEATRDIWIGAGLLAVFGPLCAVTAYLSVAGARMPGDRFRLRRLRESLRNRYDRRLQPEDPRVMVVDALPPTGLKGKAGRKARADKDFGFLLIDEGRREIVYEGARRRWRLPVGAVESVETESPSSGIETLGLMLFLGLLGLLLAHSQRKLVLALTVRTAEGPRRLCLDLNDGTKAGTKKHQERLQELHDRLEALTMSGRGVARSLPFS